MQIRTKAVCLSLLAAACAVESGDPVEPAPALEQSANRGCNALSAAEQRSVLKQIDDICGDTWCSGDYEFAFRHVTCSARAGTCTLDFDFIPREGLPNAGKHLARSCKTAGFSGFASLVTTASSGYQSLAWDYYLALTECIAELEADLA